MRLFGIKNSIFLTVQIDTMIIPGKTVVIPRKTQVIPGITQQKQGFLLQKQQHRQGGAKKYRTTNTHIAAPPLCSKKSVYSENKINKAEWGEISPPGAYQPETGRAPTPKQRPTAHQKS